MTSDDSEAKQIIWKLWSGLKTISGDYLRQSV